jgi:hypothetical protein
MLSASMNNKKGGVVSKYHQILQKSSVEREKMKFLADRSLHASQLS